MADYNTVKINDTYLTHDGTESGRPCRVEIPDLLKLRIAPRNVEEDLDGGQHVQFGDFRGFEIPMAIRRMEDDEITDLLEEIADVEAVGGLHNLIIEGPTGNFDLDCALVSIGNEGSFIDEWVETINLVWRVDTKNEYVAPGP